LKTVAKTVIKAPPRTHKTRTKAMENLSKPRPVTTSANVAALSPAPVGTDRRVQLGSVQSKARAEKEAERLTRVHKPLLHGLKIVPVRADLGKRGVFYRLRAGPLSDYAAAASLCRELSARKQSCIVTKP
jgi:cell division septation protein DedD